MFLNTVKLVAKMTFEPYREEDDKKDYLEKQVELFLTAHSLKDDKRVAFLLSWLGAKAYAILKTW